MREKASRRMAKVLFAVLCIIWTGTLCGCGAWDALTQKLGFDTYDYMSEEVLAVYDGESPIAETLTDFLQILPPSLPEFDSAGQAMQLYRDDVLDYMLRTEYARYSGNAELIQEAQKENPGYQITQIIPAREFETTMYRLFGGSVRITHKDGKRYKYLRNVNAYVASTAPISTEKKIDILQIEETAQTYRVTFTVAIGEEITEPYFALVIRRKDETLYFKQLKKTTSAWEPAA